MLRNYFLSIQIIIQYSYKVKINYPTVYDFCLKAGILRKNINSVKIKFLLQTTYLQNQENIFNTKINVHFWNLLKMGDTQRIDA